MTSTPHIPHPAPHCTARRATALLALLLIALLPLHSFCQEVAPAVAGTTSAAELVAGDDSASTGFVANVLRWYDDHMNYLTVGALMTIESSFIPFPSEVVIPPAVFVAANPDSAGGMKIWIIVLVGTLGAMLGAYINYFLSRWLGRPIIYAFVDSKVGHALMLSGEKMERAEAYFNKHGNVSTLIGRLVPVVRQLISIPAGLSKMNLGAFSLYTAVGALVWNTLLALIGYYAYKVGQLEIIKQYSHELSIVLTVIVVAALLFLVVRAIAKKRKSQATQPE